MKIAEIIRMAAGHSPLVDRQYGTPTKRATDIMRGRTHYYDSGTLAYFGAKVIRLRVVADGLALVSLERSNMDIHGERKGYRVSVHDYTGFCISSRHEIAERPEPDKMYRTRAPADRDFDAACAAVETCAADILRDALQRTRCQLERQLSATKAAQKVAK
jgi:hypothetical protein